MGKSKVIVPRKLSVDPQAMARAITNTLNSTALAIKSDFAVTAQTFDDKPTFAIESPTVYTRAIGTDDENYTRLNAGTRPHIIAPRPGGTLVFRTPFRSKTLPRQIASGPGAKGSDQVFTRKPIHHPGSAPRQFDKVIAEKWQTQVGALFQRAVDSEVS
jgi:hypothetical protein